MTTRVITTSPDAPIEEASELLRAHNISALPVIQRNRVVGIISAADIFRAFTAMTAANRNGIRLTMESRGATTPVGKVIELLDDLGIDILSIA